MPLRACLALVLLPLAAAAADPPVPPAPVVQLVPLTTVKPNIPDSACQQRLSGFVDMDFAITPEGKVADLKVVNSQPRDLFDAAAAAAVSQWTFAPGPLPTKGHEHLALGYADCRSEQMVRPRMTATGDAAVDCTALAADARLHGDRIEATEAAHRVIDKSGAMTYTAPDAACVVKGRILGNHRNLTAYLEYRGFMMVSDPHESEADAFWVWTNALAEINP
jgi:TonB family protein